MTRVGAILAGGQARRFGSDKALAVWNGRSLIDHVAAALRPHVDAMVVCGRDKGPQDLVAIPDWPAPDLGPLGGLCAALRFAAQHGHDAVLTMGCDTPILPRNLLETFASAERDQYLAEAPIIGLWSVALADPLSRHLAESPMRSVRRWADMNGVAAVDTCFGIPNLNTADDLLALSKIQAD